MDDIHSCCLTVAGSDSGGNAGVQADLRTFHSYKLHGCTVFTALTAQNPNGVYAIHPIPPPFVADQLDALLKTYAIGAMKTGMLSDPEAIEIIADKVKVFPKMAKIIDPVMVATSGARLISASAVEALKSHLLPSATLTTPNIPEAEVLAGIAISDYSDIQEAAKRIHGEFGCSVLVKGGHVGNTLIAEDTLFDGEKFSKFSLPWILEPISTHGTGCSLAAALAAEFTLGHDIEQSVKGAKEYVHAAIKNSFYVGKDCGVLGWTF